MHSQSIEIKAKTSVVLLFRKILSFTCPEGPSVTMLWSSVALLCLFTSPSLAFYNTVSIGHKYHFPETYGLFIVLVLIPKFFLFSHSCASLSHTHSTKVTMRTINRTRQPLTTTGNKCFCRNIWRCLHMSGTRMATAR